MEARDRIQDMLCQRIEILESVIKIHADRVDCLHTSINLIENSRSNKAICGKRADETRGIIREIVAALRSAGLGSTP